MLEGKYWLTKLRPEIICHSALRDWLVWKHCDRYTEGILDVSISRGKITLWFELKILPRPTTSVQANTLKKLGEGAYLIKVAKDLKCAAIEGVTTYDFCRYPRHGGVGLTSQWIANEIAKRCINA